MHPSPEQFLTLIGWLSARWLGISCWYEISCGTPQFEGLRINPLASHNSKVFYHTGASKSYLAWVMLCKPPKECFYLFECNNLGYHGQIYTPEHCRHRKALTNVHKIGKCSQKPMSVTCSSLRGYLEIFSHFFRWMSVIPKNNEVLNPTFTTFSKMFREKAQVPLWLLTCTKKTENHASHYCP